MLSEFVSGQSWPTGNNKTGDPATNYVKKVVLCMGLLMHAPVAAFVDGQWVLVPVRPLPEGKEWKDIIGFNPIEHFLPVSVE